MNRLSAFILHKVKDELQVKKNHKCFGCENELYDLKENNDDAAYSQCGDCLSYFCL